MNGEYMKTPLLKCVIIALVEFSLFSASKARRKKRNNLLLYIDEDEE